MKDKKVPEVVVRRLPRYYRYLDDLLKKQVLRISSGELSRRMGVTASQIRQDFNFFGGFGQQGYGYNVEMLHKEISAILGMDAGCKTIILGAGNLGRALANHTNFEKRGFRLIGIFDVDTAKVGKEINGITVLGIDRLAAFVEAQKPDIAILAVPKAVVHEVAETLVRLGVKALWNFSYVELDANEAVAVENVHLSDSLMMLSYKLKNLEPDAGE